MKPGFSRMIAVALGVAIAGCATTNGRSVSGNVRPDTVDPAVRSPAGPSGVDRGGPRYSPADVHFMSGMIPHHAQAVLMAGWAPTHGASPAVRLFAERMVVSQEDEIAFMQRWLGERGETVPDADPLHAHHGTLMPGMLTGEELAQLESATEAEFDRLFLTFMIRHHEGAITMVETLFAAEGAAQDEDVFRFASDVFADQISEIDRMHIMLDAVASEGER